jgi:hypothetical protein
LSLTTRADGTRSIFGGSGQRMTFRDGEAILSSWMDANALVSWVAHPRPWAIETELIKHTSLALNLDQNDEHAHHLRLSEVRRFAKARARQLPICH